MKLFIALLVSAVLIAGMAEANYGGFRQYPSIPGQCVFGQQGGIPAPPQINQPIYPPYFQPNYGGCPPCYGNYPSKKIDHHQSQTGGMLALRGSGRFSCSDFSKICY